MDKKERIDGLYMKMAFIWAQNSYAIRRKVGCLIVKNNRIISDGYNGTPCGFENICEEIPEDVLDKLRGWLNTLLFTALSRRRRNFKNQTLCSSRRK